MRALIVILIILAVIALLVHIPVRIRIYAKYENSKFTNDYEIKYGFLTVKRRKEKAKKPKSEKRTENDGAKKKDKPKPIAVIRFIKENIALIKRLITETVGYTTKKLIRFEKFSVKSYVGVDNAMYTALIYGNASAFLYNTVGLLERSVRMKNISIDFQPDFKEQKIFIEFESIIRTKIYNVFGLAWVALRHAMPLVKKRGDLNNGKSD